MSLHIYRSIKGTISSRKALGVVLSLAFLLVVFNLALAAISKGSSSEERQNFSAMGTVTEVASSVLTLSIEGSARTFDPSSVEKVESKNYTRLSLGDIVSGDTVIVQGFSKDGAVVLNRVIDMTWSGAVAPSAPATEATTTVEIATSTDSTASSTDVTATTTEEVIAPETATSTDGIASTTEATTTVEIATSTDSTASSTDPVQ